MNELANTGQIDVVDSGALKAYSADRAARERVKALSDEEFEKEVKKMPYEMEQFLRIMRNS